MVGDNMKLNEWRTKIISTKQDAMISHSKWWTLAKTTSKFPKQRQVLGAPITIIIIHFFFLVWS